MRVDVVSDSVIRVRIAAGTAVPANDTPMLVGSVASPTACDVRHEPERMVYETPRARLSVDLNPFRLTVGTAQDADICVAGGRDKNYFNLTGLVWDSYNTGICRTLPDGDPLAVEIFDLGRTRPSTASASSSSSWTRSAKPSTSTWSTPSASPPRAATRTSPSS